MEPKKPIGELKTRELPEVELGEQGNPYIHTLGNPVSKDIYEGDWVRTVDGSGDPKEFFQIVSIKNIVWGYNRRYVKQLMIAKGVKTTAELTDLDPKWADDENLYKNKITLYLKISKKSDADTILRRYINPSDKTRESATKNIFLATHGFNDKNKPIIELVTDEAFLEAFDSVIQGMIENSTLIRGGEDVKK